jgi:addiction module RelE/StbE family toxin
MKIRKHKDFQKDFRKLRKGEKERVFRVLEIFCQNPNHEILNNHLLKGKHLGKRSINAGGDLRIIFQETDDYFEVLFLAIGSHAKLYG